LLPTESLEETSDAGGVVTKKGTIEAVFVVAFPQIFAFFGTYAEKPKSFKFPSEDVVAHVPAGHKAKGRSQWGVEAEDRSDRPQVSKSHFHPNDVPCEGRNLGLMIASAAIEIVIVGPKTSDAPLQLQVFSVKHDAQAAGLPLDGVRIAARATEDFHLGLSLSRQCG
jgi:hypothetical protein